MGPQVVHPRAVSAPHGKPDFRILLVDENTGDLNFLQGQLEMHGLQVHGCTSHRKALECLEHGAFDFIVVSQGSRAFEGRSVLARAIELNRWIPVLILTDVLDIGCYLEAMQLGAIDYLEKPMRGPEFVDTVKGHLPSPCRPLYRYGAGPSLLQKDEERTGRSNGGAE